MKKTFILSLIPAIATLIIFAGWSDADTTPKKDSCVECHQQLEEKGKEIVNLMEHDVHIKIGLTCVSCHGGDPNSDDMTESMSKEKGFLGVPKRNEIPQFCSRCHSDPGFMRRYNPNLPTDQYLKYQTSQHGKLNAKGDDHVAVCVSCHGAHGIRRIKDPMSPVYKRNAPLTCSKCHSNATYMAAYKIPTNQFEEYKKGVHGQMLLEKGDLGAPACHSCHGSHEASKPGEIWIGNVCAQCHSINRDLFAASPHKEAHDMMGVPECAICHENHFIQKTSDEMLGTGPGAVCITCHDQDSKGYHSASSMRSYIEALKNKMSTAKSELDNVENLGMDMTESLVEMDQAKSLLTKSRSYVHSFSPDKIQSITEEGNVVADKILKEADAAQKEIIRRRQGLWLSILFLLLLMTGLLLHVKRLDKINAKRKNPSH